MAQTGKAVEKIKKAKEAFVQSVVNISKLEPWHPIVIGGKEYKLEFSFSAVKEIFRELGVNMQSGELTPDHLTNLDHMVIVLRAGLRRHQPEFAASADLEDQLQMSQRIYYIWAVQQAQDATQPDMSEIEAFIKENEDKEAEGEVQPPLVVMPPFANSGPPVE